MSKSQEQILADEVIEFKRFKLNELLSQCTESQQKFFFVVFKPQENLIENIKPDNLDSAIALCRRTIASNKGEG